MPLRAKLKGETLLSYKMSSVEWETLKTSNSKRLLTLPCCNQRAIVKTSPLGTKFFAHYRKSEECISKPESKEHLRLKAIVSSAAESAGWSVATEYVGYSKTGDKWIADVYCTKGKAKVALEIQLSLLTAEEINARHNRYVESDVRDAWFMKDSVYVNSGHSSIKSFPRFQISHFMDDRPSPQMVDYPISVERFVNALLNKQLVWKEDTDETLIYYMKSNCWKCKEKLHIPIGLGDTLCSNYDDFIKTVPNCSNFYSKLVTEISNAELNILGLTIIGTHPNMKGNAPNYPYCVQCTHCSAPQSNYHTLENYHNWARKTGERKCFIVLSSYSHNGRYELAPLIKKSLE